MLRGFKFRLILNKEQEEYCWRSANAARFIYNWALETKIKAYKETGLVPSGFNICTLLTQFKKQSEYAWLNNVLNKTLQCAILDCEDAFQKMYKGKNNFPKYKSKKKTTPSFSIDCESVRKGYIMDENGEIQEKYIKRIRFFRDNTVKISGIGLVKLSKNAKKIGLWYITENNINVYNARIKFDGEYWNLSFSINLPRKQKELTDEVLGIDVGVKDTAICSNGIVYKNINKTSDNIKRLEKRKELYKNKIAKKYELNKVFNKSTGRYTYRKTNNIKKLEAKLYRINKKLINIRENYNHQISHGIIQHNPKAIVMEDLNLRGMIKNVYMARALKQQKLYQLKTFIKYKSENQGTRFIEVPRNFKSTQICCKCGAEHKMTLSDRIYICNICGHIEDRDMNSAHNLRNYGLSLLNA